MGAPLGIPLALVGIDNRCLHAPLPRRRLQFNGSPSSALLYEIPATAISKTPLIRENVSS